LRALEVLGLLIVKVSGSHSYTSQSGWELWTCDRQHSHAPGGVRTLNSSKWAAKDPCLRRCMRLVGSGNELNTHRKI